MEGCRVIAPFDPFAPAFYESRYAAYRRYQEEDPFHWGVGGVPTRVGTWYVFGYDDIAAILRDTRFGKRSASPTAPGAYTVIDPPLVCFGPLDTRI